MRARVFITGSSDGLGLAAARSLIDEGHAVVAHARSQARAAQTREALPGAEAVLVADLASRDEVLALAQQATGFDAVIHNAAVGFREPRRSTPEGHAHVLAINVLAPYILIATMQRPRRLILLSSGMHSGGDGSLRDLDWTQRRWSGAQAYSDSKLFDTALALAIARRWTDVLSNAVTPGWVATKMGGAGAPDDLSQGHVTQAWLAVSDDPRATVSGRLFYHQREIEPAPVARDHGFQDRLVDALGTLTGIALPAGT